MISENDIASCCRSKTMQRARHIAAHGRDVTARQCRHGERGTTISAFVASSSGWSDRYRTRVVLDEDEKAVLDFSCTCPAFLDYDGMCKHAAALALVYLDDPFSFSGYHADRSPQTSPSITAFMQRAHDAALRGEQMPISVETTLVYGFENWSARFKLRGPRGSYVLKNLDDFAHALGTQSFVAYGKKLAFAHTLEAFEEKSRPVVALIQHVASRRRNAADHLSFRAGKPKGVGKVLQLTEGEVVELLDAIGSSPFDVECTDATMRSRMRAKVADGVPRIPLRITRGMRGGFAIEHDEPIVFVAEAERMFLLHDETFFRCPASFARIADFLRSVYRAGDERLFVSDEDMPLFCATALPLLEQSLAVSCPPEVDLMRPVDVKLAFFFDRSGNAVEVSAVAQYGQRSFTLIAPSPSGQAISSDKTQAADEARFAPVRDAVLEGRAIQLVNRFFDASATLALGDGQALADLLFGGLAQFRELGDVFTTPAFDRLLTTRTPRIHLGLSLAGNLVNLDISADDLDPSELADTLQSYRLKRRFHRLRDGAFVNLADHELHELDRLAKELGIDASLIASGTVEVPSYRAFYLDHELPTARKDPSFEAYAGRLRSIDPTFYTPPPRLEHTLRPYQREGFAWLSTLLDLGLGGILADEMGLGKSLQLISLLLARKEEARAVGRSLIVCPASLVYNWVAEFSAFAPELAVCAVEGDRAQRQVARADEGADVLVTSYDLARIDAQHYAKERFFCLVLDEAQYVKNHAALTTRAVKRLDALHRIALTGTPLENRLSEMWSLFDFLMPGFLGSYARFRERYESDIIGGNEQAAERLHTLTSPFILRRLKRDVMPELPDKTESIVRVPLAGEQRRLYAGYEQNLRILLAQQKKKGAAERQSSRIEVLAELTKLRQIALDPALILEGYGGGAAKTPVIMELIAQSRESGEKTLVFSQFTSYLARLAHELAAQGIPHYLITGATPKKERVERVDAFNHDDTPVFLVSLKAGGTGLNLIGASAVIHADPWWNAAATDQATDRAHRIGQTNMVNVYKVIAKDTVEERILALQQAKTDLADAVIGKTSALSLSQLTQEELLDLLSGGK